MIETEITLINKLGLHARAATKLASTAGRYDCTIRTGHKGKVVDAKSVMSLMLLAASCGTRLTFSFDGEEESEAHAAILALVENRFGEEE